MVFSQINYRSTTRPRACSYRSRSQLLVTVFLRCITTDRSSIVYSPTRAHPYKTSNAICPLPHSYTRPYNSYFTMSSSHPPRNRVSETLRMLDFMARARVPGNPRSPAAADPARTKSVYTLRREQMLRSEGVELDPNCTHKVWLQFRSTSIPCEICEATMPKYTFVRYPSYIHVKRRG